MGLQVGVETLVDLVEDEPEVLFERGTLRILPGDTVEADKEVSEPGRVLRMPSPRRSRGMCSPSMEMEGECWPTGTSKVTLRARASEKHDRRR